MRCLAVANTLRERGASCYFICRDLPGNLSQYIASQSFDVEVLARPEPSSERQSELCLGSGRAGYEAWLGTDWVNDQTASRAAVATWLPGGVADWLVVDHYALDFRWEKAMSPAYQHLMVIDDLADRRHECDALIDQNIGRTPNDYLAWVNPDCTLLMGPSYALLRPEFPTIRRRSLDHRANRTIRKLLISMGGIDKDNATGAVIAGLSYCDLPQDIEILVVMGEQAPWLEQVRAKVAALPFFATTLTAVSDMASLMAEADIAIGAAGTTTWERCCLGLPSIVIGTAENQRYVLSQLAAEKLVVIGDLSDIRGNPDALRILMKQLIDGRECYSRRSAELTEGNGCQMLADYISGGSIPK
jgi:UDP-2,4-diacetamido-2,4,6-trideoxy-beta-L-altropyranose hydrolase